MVSLSGRRQRSQDEQGLHERQATGAHRHHHSVGRQALRGGCRRRSEMGDRETACRRHRLHEHDRSVGVVVSMSNHPAIFRPCSGYIRLNLGCTEHDRSVVVGSIPNHPAHYTTHVPPGAKPTSRRPFHHFIFLFLPLDGPSTILEIRRSRTLEYPR